MTWIIDKSKPPPATTYHAGAVHLPLSHYHAIEAPSTTRARRHRERRSRGVVLVAPVEVGEGGLGLLVSNGLLKEHETRDRKAVGEAFLTALEQWSDGHGALSTGQG